MFTNYLFLSSGSAFPATLAFQIRELERQTSGDLKLDAIVTVVDAENFAGYEDTSPTAKMQASYTDIILIVRFRFTLLRKVVSLTIVRQNKWEHVSERALDLVIDHLNTLNDLTPKIKCQGRDGVDPNLVFGLGTKLFAENDSYPAVSSHNDEVETVTVHRGSSWSRSQHRPHNHHHGDDQCDCARNTPEDKGHDLPIDSEVIEREVLESALHGLSKESIWRVKGFVRLKLGSGPGTANERVRSQVHILNWAFGRYDLTPFLPESGIEESEVIRLTVMGERGEVRRAIRRFGMSLSAQVL